MISRLLHGAVTMVPLVALLVVALPPTGVGADAPAYQEQSVTSTTLFVDAQSNAARQAEAWRLSRPEDADLMEKIASQPQADWFGDWNQNVEADVDRRVDAAQAANAVPVLVAYNIPNRDCGSYSGGGARSKKAYRTWIRSFADGIGQRPAIVVLEPDALAHSCAGQAERLGLIRDAVNLLAAPPNIQLYLDIGHPGWLQAEEAASRLRAAGVDAARGFSLNVSNFHHTADNLRYGHEIARHLGGAHFVIDTSRNGLGPSGDQWCNPDGRALGLTPTMVTGDPLADAFLWIKRPGESDGTCNGGPAAGTWWPEYALGLARLASF